MRVSVLATAMLLNGFGLAQDQSGCPNFQPLPAPNCGSGNTDRNIKVHVATLDTRDGNDSGTYAPAGGGGYSSPGSKVGPEMMADTVSDVEQHQYRACDIGLEIVERVRESFQHLGYFCAAVEPIQVRQAGKNEYNIRIHVHPGEKYRVGEIKFTGATLLSADELKSELHLKPNSLFNPESVRRGLERIRKSYVNKGQPTVTTIPVATVDEKNKSVALEIKVQESTPSQ